MASGGSFMDMMGDDAGTDDISISLPYEQEGYAEQNGFDIPTPTGKKACKVTAQEDETLIMAWESVSLDPVKGNEQSSSTYRKRIYDHYHRNKRCASDRSLNSLQHRWGTIQECCNKWAGCMSKVERQSPSGVPYQEHVSN